MTIYDERLFGGNLQKIFINNFGKFLDILKVV